jgi:predicted nucleic acid-binding protein
MSAKYFIDTNVFVYSFDDRQPVKKERSLAIIQDGLRTGMGVISTQVIQEFLNVATEKFAVPMKPEDSKMYLRLVMNPLCQIYPNSDLYEICLDIKVETGYSFYDSLILAGAIQGGCATLYSEDLQDGQVVRGVRVIDPFAR